MLGLFYTSIKILRKQTFLHITFRLNKSNKHCHNILLVVYFNCYLSVDILLFRQLLFLMRCASYFPFPSHLTALIDIS